MGRAVFNNKQSLTSSDLNAYQDLFERFLKNNTKAVLSLDKLTAGQGAVLSTDSSDQYMLYVEAGTSASTIKIYLGYAIDKNAEYIEKISTAEIDVFNYGIVNNGTYNIYIGYAETASEAGTDDKGDTYYTEYIDSFEVDMTSSTKASPWIKIGEFVYTAGTVVSVTSTLYGYDSDVNNSGRLQSAVTSKGVWISSGATAVGSGSVVAWSWQKDMQDHVEAIGDGTVSSTNPHGVEVDDDWDSFSNKPTYLVGGARHGNGTSLYDPINSNWTAYPSHKQNIGDGNDTLANQSGSVLVSRFGTSSTFNTDISIDVFSDTVKFNSTKVKSFPYRQGGTSIWVDGYIETDNYGAVAIPLDSSLDWRYRMVNIEGILLGVYGLGYVPGGSYQDEIYDAYSIDNVEGGTIGYLNDSIIDGKISVQAFGYLSGGSKSEDLAVSSIANVSTAELRSYIYSNCIPLSVLKEAVPVTLLYADEDTGVLTLFMQKKSLVIDSLTVTPYFHLNVKCSPKYTEYSSDDTADGSDVVSANVSATITYSEYLQLAKWIQKNITNSISSNEFDGILNMSIYIMTQGYSGSDDERSLIRSLFLKDINVPGDTVSYYQVVHALSKITGESTATTSFWVFDGMSALGYL